MHTIIRTHVKNEARLNLLARTIESALNKGLEDLGSILVADDHSPLGDKVRRLCEAMAVEYHGSMGLKGSTKNGLVSSFRLARGLQGREVLHVCDDIVFGKGTKEFLQTLFQYPVPADWWMISLFAAYPQHVRNQNQVFQTPLWRYPTDSFYAGLAVIYHEDLMEKAITEWDLVERAEAIEPPWQDDLWMKQLCIDNRKSIYNSNRDYAQHTGVKQRSFGDDPEAGSSEYVTDYFVGE